MNRRDAVISLLALGTTPITAHSQQNRKVWRIGILGPGNVDVVTVEDEFIKAMRALGYVLDRDYVVETRFAKGDASRLPTLAMELVERRVDLIIPQSTSAAIAARDATNVIPIVIIGAVDPIGTGLVRSLAHPDGNVTGLARHAGISTKHIDLLSQMIPGIVRVGALYEPRDVLQRRYVNDIEIACKQLGIRMIGAPVGNPDEIANAFVHLKQARAQGLLVFQSPTTVGSRKKIIELAAKQRLPAIFSRSEWVDEGGLISYNADFVDLERRVAKYVQRIFEGAKPGDLPIEQPDTFNLVVNRKTAKAIGLAIPQSLLIIANRVVE